MPENTPSLGILRLKSRDKNLRMITALDLFLRRVFPKKFDGFLQIGGGFLNIAALAGNIQFGTERDVAITNSITHLPASLRPSVVSE